MVQADLPPPVTKEGDTPEDTGLDGALWTAAFGDEPPNSEHDLSDVLGEPDPARSLEQESVGDVVRFLEGGGDAVR